MTRRVALGALGASLADRSLGQDGERSETAALPRRVLVGSGRELPLLGLGCFPVGNLDDEKAALCTILHAWESGARYFDTAPSYGDGRSERRLGRALSDVPRAELFVATKTLRRDGDGALAELEAALERLGMDYVDSVQIHAVASTQDLDVALAADGALKALESAREMGKLRHIGVTGHYAPRCCYRPSSATPSPPRSCP
jgi:aryl-alcohol dehydrogenase-like predicted oxidoreductase